MKLRTRLQFWLVAFLFMAWMFGPMYLLCYLVQKVFPGNYWLAGTCILFPFAWFPFAFYCQKKIRSRTVTTILEWFEGGKKRRD